MLIYNITSEDGYIDSGIPAKDVTFSLNIDGLTYDAIQQNNIGCGFFKRGKDSNCKPNVTTSVWNDRFFWSDFEPSDGIYQLPNHEMFNQTDQAISFGIRCFIERDTTRRFPATIPHKVLATGEHVPDWDHPTFHSRLRTLLGNVRSLLGNRVVAWIEIRIFGTFGEWHQHGLIDAPSISVESQQSIVDAHLHAFSDRCQLIMMGDAPHMIKYANERMSEFGSVFVYNPYVGYRLDSLGHSRFNAIKNSPEWGDIEGLWEYAPIIAETYGNLTHESALVVQEQIVDQHVIFVANGNLKQKWTTLDPVVQARWSEIPLLTLQASYPSWINVTITDTELRFNSYMVEPYEVGTTGLYVTYELLNPLNGRAEVQAAHTGNYRSVRFNLETLETTIGFKKPVLATNEETTKLVLNASYSLYKYSLPLYHISLELDIGLSADELLEFSLVTKQQLADAQSALAQQQFKLQAALDKIQDQASTMYHAVQRIIQENTQ